MLAYKTQFDIGSNTLLLQLPEGFMGKHVEIIVLETGNAPEQLYDTIVKSNVSESENISEFQKALLQAPTWTDGEYQSFIDNRNNFSSWEIK